MWVLVPAAASAGSRSGCPFCLHAEPVKGPAHSDVLAGCHGDHPRGCTLSQERTWQKPPIPFRESVLLKPRALFIRQRTTLSLPRTPLRRHRHAASRRDVRGSSLPPCCACPSGDTRSLWGGHGPFQIATTVQVWAPSSAHREIRPFARKRLQEDGQKYGVRRAEDMPGTRPQLPALGPWVRLGVRVSPQRRPRATASESQREGSASFAKSLSGA